MSTTDYKATPQAKNLLAHLHSINPDFDIDIIYPKERWPNIETRKSPEVMDIIRQHHKVSKNGLGNDIGLDAFVHRNRDADLWIHILDKDKNKLPKKKKYYMNVYNKHYFIFQSFNILEFILYLRFLLVNYFFKLIDHDFLFFQRFLFLQI